MTNLIVIKPHSFIDVITNSSTELFVCDAGRDVETVKEILDNIIKGYNIMTGGNVSYDDFFKFPTLFNLKEFQEWKKSERSYRSDFNTVAGWFADNTSEEDIMELRKSFIEYGTTNSRSDFHQRIIDAATKNGKFDSKLNDAEIDKIYDEIITGVESKPYWWNEPWKYHYSEKCVSELDGCILVKGSDDNSIPYELFDIIETTLNSERYHLG